MDAPNRSQLYAAGLTVAIAVGVYLGNSAISSINPAHFRGAATYPAVRGELATVPEPAPLYGAQFSRDEAMLIRAAVCPGCDGTTTTPALFYSTAVPYFGSREERAAAAARERRAIDAAYAARERRREERPMRLGLGGPFEPAAASDERVAASRPDLEADREMTEERGE
jgi:hypothetical protein